MLEFKTLQLSDRAWVEPLLAAEGSRSAGYNFGTLYLWAPMWRQSVARLDDRLIIRYDQEAKTYFAFPVGSGPLKPAIEVIAAHAAEVGAPCLRLFGVTCLQKAALEAVYPGHFRFEHTPDSDDYLYATEKLATLSGKKLHAKRNHCNKFEQTYDWRFEPMTASHFPAVLELLQRWNDEKDENGGISLQAEWEAVCRAIDGFAELQLEGGVLFAENEPVAFTMGSPSYGSTMDVHFEKVRPDIPNAYAMINREFARMVQQKHPELRYLNREEDLGLEGLRKAKQSYHPVSMVEKFTAIQEG